jgi:NADH-quinone oxidoreductase subunit N
MNDSRELDLILKIFYDWLAMNPQFDILMGFSMSKIFITLFIMFITIYGVIFSKAKKVDEILNIFSFIAYLTCIALLLAVYMDISIYFDERDNPFHVFYFQQGFIINVYTYFNTIFIYMITCIICALSVDYFNDEAYYANFEYFILILLSLLGIIVLTNSTNLLITYLGIELQSLPLYVLVSFRRFNKDSTEAGLKYFTLGGFASALYLFGTSIIYGLTGTLDIFTLSILLENIKLLDSLFYYGIILGLSLILSTLFFKLSSFPFHTWTPDVYAGSILPVVMFIGTVSKIGAFVFLSNLTQFILIYISDIFSLILTITGLGSLFIGTFGALYQSNIKRLLAYSTVGHMGYALLGLSTITIDGLVSANYYLFVYIILNLITFAALITIQDRTGGQKYLETIYDLNYIQTGNIYVSVLFSTIFLSVAGVPPLLGFFNKYLVLYSLIEAGSYITAFITVIFSIISAYYYLRIVKMMLFEKLIPKYEKLELSSSLASYILVTLILINATLILLIDETQILFTEFFINR